jgi:hypothetical protein
MLGKQIINWTVSYSYCFLLAQYCSITMQGCLGGGYKPFFRIPGGMVLKKQAKYS